MNELPLIKYSNKHSLCYNYYVKWLCNKNMPDDQPKNGRFSLHQKKTTNKFRNSEFATHQLHFIITNGIWRITSHLY